MDRHCQVCGALEDGLWHKCGDCGRYFSRCCATAVPFLCHECLGLLEPLEP